MQCSLYASPEPRSAKMKQKNLLFIPLNTFGNQTVLIDERCVSVDGFYIAFNFILLQSELNKKENINRKTNPTSF